MQRAMGKHKDNEILLLIVYYEMIMHYDYRYFLTYFCLDTMITVACGFINILEAELGLLNLWSCKYLLFCSYKNSVHLGLLPICIYATDFWKLKDTFRVTL